VKGSQPLVEGDRQTELWQQAETDEQWEASIAGSHVLALTDWFLHKYFIETIHVGMSVLSSNWYFI